MAEKCWLNYHELTNIPLAGAYREYCKKIIVRQKTPVLYSAIEELWQGISGMLGECPAIHVWKTFIPASGIWLVTLDQLPEGLLETAQTCQIGKEGFLIKALEYQGKQLLVVTGRTELGILYGVFCLLRLIQMEVPISELERLENPANPLRLLNHWDNLDGSIERGYAGSSLFFRELRIEFEGQRLKDYARLLTSIGINGIVINNVNVRTHETRLITADYLKDVARLAEVFRPYGIRLYLSVNFASPIHLGKLATADPLDEAVRDWWSLKAGEIYRAVPDLGGFLVKADSEHNPGPFNYGRSHADGANMLAEALQPYDGIVLWRCFVYNCTQDWRDTKTDRARAAYDHFKGLDGSFLDNVILQIKNGPVDFQVREPVSPLLGGMTKTNQVLELQITQEYTGQQIHLCYLVPQWKEVLDFETYALPNGAPVKEIGSGKAFHRNWGGFAGVANIGADLNWTGHDLAQANLYGFGRLAWNPDCTAADLASEWIRLTFSSDARIVETIKEMLLRSWPIYESYTAPLGIGWMVNPNHHYGPNVDGYEFSQWGTYHRADSKGMGVERSVKTGTGYAGQYYPPNSDIYESLETCPDELVLFFHHIPYTHRLKSGLTLIQHIYNSHFDGVDQVVELQQKWNGLKGRIPDGTWERVAKRLAKQLESAQEWRDAINTYFYQKSGIADELGREIPI